MGAGRGAGRVLRHSSGLAQVCAGGASGRAIVSRSWQRGSTSKWRNRQTRQLEGLVLERGWGFKSPLRHHFKAVQPQGDAVDALLTLRDTIKKGADPQTSLEAALPKITALTKQAHAAWKAAGLTACVG